MNKNTVQTRPAIWGHDFEDSGEMAEFAGYLLHQCRWCGWPYDEHPNHPSRRENRHIVAVMLDEKRTAVWG